MLRRDFLRSLALNAAGLYVAPDALEAILEPRRKYWPGTSFGPAFHVHYIRYAQLRIDPFGEGATTTLSVEAVDHTGRVHTVIGVGRDVVVGDVRVRVDGDRCMMIRA